MHCEEWKEEVCNVEVNDRRWRGRGNEVPCSMISGDVTKRVEDGAENWTGIEDDWSNLKYSAGKAGSEIHS